MAFASAAHRFREHMHFTREQRAVRLRCRCDTDVCVVVEDLVIGRRTDVDARLVVDLHVVTLAAVGRDDDRAAVGAGDHAGDPRGRCPCGARAQHRNQDCNILQQSVHVLFPHRNPLPFIMHRNFRRCEQA